MMKRGPQDNPIIVTGQRPAKDSEVRAALRELAMRGRSMDRPLARFQEQLCVSVFGLGDRFGTQVKKRIERNAREAGLAVETRLCKPNATVVVVRNPDRLVEATFKRRGRVISPEARRNVRAAQERGDVALAWSIEEITAAPGGAAAVSSDVASAVGFGSGALGPPGFTSISASRLRPNFALSRTNAMIVFDVDRLAGVHLNQLADFATMRLLSDPQAVVDLQVGALGSILTLFDHGIDQAAPELTPLDRAYLTGLYKMRSNDPGTLLERFVLAAYREKMGDYSDSAITDD